MRLFEGEYITDHRSDDPEQFRAIGWVSGTLYSVIYEVREDMTASSTISSHSGKRRKRRRKHMSNTSAKAAISADDLAQMADEGKDISAHFTHQFTVKRSAVQRVNVDFATPMLQELDHEAETLNISRQAVIKTMLREALDRRYLANKARQAH